MMDALLQKQLFDVPIYSNFSTIQESKRSSHLLLRRSAVACLRQLAQREANEISDYARTLYKPEDEDEQQIIAENGLEGALFSLLDRETDRPLRKVHTLNLPTPTSIGSDLKVWPRSS